MNVARSAVFFMFISCTVGAPPDCITRCGVRVFNALPDAGQTCDEFQFTEDVAIREFQFTTDERLHTCTLQDWNVEVQPTVNFWTLGELKSGRTFCFSETMLINGIRPNRSSLPHEMAHALQRCAPKPPFDDSDYDHSNWQDGGIYDAISRVRSAR